MSEIRVNVRAAAVPFDVLILSPRDDSQLRGVVAHSIWIKVYYTMYNIIIRCAAVIKNNFSRATFSFVVLVMNARCNKQVLTIIIR